MPLTASHRRDIVKGYCILFYLLMVYKIWNGFLLYQHRPFIFNNRYDLFTSALMGSGIHQWLLNNPQGWLLFDVAFYSMPLLFWIAFKRNIRLASIVAFLMLLVNWIYIQFYTLYPVNSIESFTAWLLFPFLLMTTSLRSFYFVLHGLRYFFLYFFASAAVWKIVQGAVFNPAEMSGILLFQHKEYLTSSADWYTRFIYWLINYPEVGFGLYWAATVLELTFFVGFFTRKADKFFVAGFVLFLIADILFMRIPYWEVTPFILTLVYSKYKYPQSSTELQNTRRTGIWFP